MSAQIISSGFIPINKLSKTIGVPMPTLRRWERSGSMPASIRFGGRIRYWKVAILKLWIESLECMPKDKQAEVWGGIQSVAAQDKKNPTMPNKS